MCVISCDLTALIMFRRLGRLRGFRYNSVVSRKPVTIPEHVPTWQAPYPSSTPPEISHSQLIDLINQRIPEDTMMPMRSFSVDHIVLLVLSGGDYHQLVLAADAQLDRKTRLEVYHQVVTRMPVETDSDLIRMFDIFCSGADRLDMVAPVLSRVSRSQLENLLALLEVSDPEVWLVVASMVVPTPETINLLLRKLRLAEVVAWKRHQYMWQFALIIVQHRAWAASEAITDAGLRDVITYYICRYISSIPDSVVILEQWNTTVQERWLKQIIHGWQLRMKVQNDPVFGRVMARLYKNNRSSLETHIPVILEGIVEDPDRCFCDRLSNLQLVVNKLRSMKYRVSLSPLAPILLHQVAIHRIEATSDVRSLQLLSWLVDARAVPLTPLVSHLIANARVEPL